MQTDRQKILHQLAQIIFGIQRSYPIRVAIDGVDASGKSVLADELKGFLEHSGREVIRVSIDGFHQPRELRHRQGRYSPKGYYEDSFDYPAIISNVLQPLGPGGDKRYKTSVFDYRADKPTNCQWEMAKNDSILLFDGIFLNRPELKPFWEFTLFVKCSFVETLRRALKRDLTLFGTRKEIEKAYQNRYIPGQKIYLEKVRPEQLSDVVLDNNDHQKPTLIINNSSLAKA